MKYKIFALVISSLLLSCMIAPSCTPQTPAQEPPGTELEVQDTATGEPQPADEARPDVPGEEAPSRDGGEPTAPTPDASKEPVPEATAEQQVPDSSLSCTPLSEANLQSTWEWAKTKGTPLATGILISQNGKVLIEAYAPENAMRLIATGGGIAEVYGMFSQTKSLTGLAALLLVKQKKLQLDDKVSQYISEWVGVKDKEDITIRELLSLSGGIQTSVNSPTDQNAERAIKSPFTGKKFAYGSEPFLIFSVLVKRVTSLSAEDFLKKHLFDPLGVQMTIKKTVDGYSSMAQGGQVTLRAMVKLGEELNRAAHGKSTIFSKEDIQTLMKPGLNPSYGLSVWLNQQGYNPEGGTFDAPWPVCGETGLFSFLGAGGQILTITPIKQLVVAKSARFGAVASQSTTDFWTKLFQGDSCTCLVP